MNSVSSAPRDLAEKPHYPVLDGLRGVAALMVVAFHILEPNDFGIRFNQIVNHGYLAVDFFFLLSGFVVSYAYDNRWQRMGLWSFVKRRLIRLQPMIVLGSLIGAALFYFQRGSTFPSIAATTPWKLVGVLLLGCTLLPLPVQADVRGWQEMHPLNGPAWSLFFEYIANILYALWLRRLSTRWLGLLTGAAALFLVHMLCSGEGDAIGGWSLDKAQLHIGFARMLFPFLAGMLLMRSGRRIQIAHSFYVCSFLLVLCFALPRFGGSSQLWKNALYESVCILVIFPLILAMGAGSVPVPAASSRLCRSLGNLSYPLYLTHYPLIYIYTAWIGQSPHSVFERAAWGVVLWVVAVTLAYACLKLYDEPVRKRLALYFLPGKMPGLLASSKGH